MLIYRLRPRGPCDITTPVTFAALYVPSFNMMTFDGENTARDNLTCFLCAL